MQRVLNISQPQMTSQRDGLVTILSVPERLVGTLFGCWHRRMSWPITRDGQTYRACLKCGVRRSFDAKTWKLLVHFTAVISQQRAGFRQDNATKLMEVIIRLVKNIF